jgi:hypothetical protein
MVRLSFFAVGLLLAAISLTACSRNNAAPSQTANQAPPAPQADSDHGDDDDAPAVEIAPSRISMEPRPTPQGFTPVDENATVVPVEEAPPTPSIFRSLGRALRRGVTETVQGAGEDTTADPPATEETPEQGPSQEANPGPEF